MSSIAKWKLACMMLAVSCLFLSYRVFDQGITRTYLDASQESSVEQIKLLGDLITYEWRDLNEAQVLTRLNAYAKTKQANPVLIKSELQSNSIYLETVRFEFQNSRLISTK